MEHNEHIHEHKVADNKDAGRSIVIAMIPAFVVFSVEIYGGIVSGSLALLADAGHIAIDIGSLVISYIAVWVARKPANDRKSYGYYRVEILAALINSLLIIATSIYICYEAYSRFGNPEDVKGNQMLIFASIGLVANLVSMWFLHRGHNHNMNVQSAYLHLISDALGAVGAIAGSIVIMLTGWMTIDPIISVFIAVMILKSAWDIIRDATDVLLEAVPKSISIKQIERELLAMDSVKSVHDLHIWTITSGVYALSSHVVVTDYGCSRDLITKINKLLLEKFSIEHVTIQLEDAFVEKEIDC
jgi:cobalt-zinc-cadmium efflux system protein